MRLKIFLCCVMHAVHEDWIAFPGWTANKSPINQLAEYNTLLLTFNSSTTIKQILFVYTPTMLVLYCFKIWLTMKTEETVVEKFIVFFPGYVYGITCALSFCILSYMIGKNNFQECLNKIEEQEVVMKCNTMQMSTYIKNNGKA